MYNFTMAQRKNILFSLLLLTAFIVRYYFSLPPLYLESDQYVASEVELRGKIVSEPDVRDTTTRYIFQPEEGFGEYKILITAERFPEFNYGDAIEFKGKIEFPKNFESDLGREFDYENYLAKDDIRYVSFRPLIEVLARGEGNIFLSFLYKIKNSFIKNIQNALPEPSASLALGITIGVKQSLGDELLDIFRRVGIIHIVVLSGYNMTIILVGVLYSLGKFPNLKRGISLLIAVILMLSFALIVGFSATVLRATIMALLAILARFLGRPVLALRTLFVAGIAMVFWNPMILFYDPSFQLSFLATFGLIVVSPIIERKFSFLSHIQVTSLKWKQVFKEIFLATVSTQIFVLPALIYMTGQFSIISLPVNLLVLPLVPLAMLFTGVSGIFGFIPFISKILAFPAYFILEFIIKISELASAVPLAAVSVSTVSLWVVFLVYIIYLTILWRERNYFQSHPNLN